MQEFFLVNNRVASQVGNRSLTDVCAYGPNGSVAYSAFLGSLEGVLESAAQWEEPTWDYATVLGTVWP